VPGAAPRRRQHLPRCQKHTGERTLSKMDVRRTLHASDTQEMHLPTALPSISLVQEPLARPDIKDTSSSLGGASTMLGRYSICRSSMVLKACGHTQEAFHRKALVPYPQRDTFKHNLFKKTRPRPVHRRPPSRCRSQCHGLRVAKKSVSLRRGCVHPAIGFGKS
jgi:hypothetical protein